MLTITQTPLSPVSYRTGIFANMATVWTNLATFRVHAQKRPEDYFWFKIWLHIQTLCVQFPIRRESSEIWPRFRVFLNKFSAAQCACSKTAIKLLPAIFLTPNLKFPWAVSYSSTNFGGASTKIYTCFVGKTFLMQNFWIWGLVGVEVKIFWWNALKAHPWLISHVLSHRSCKSVHGFLLQACARKKGHYKKSQRRYISPIRENSRPNKI